jgi:catechol 2,3-dioxygenase-like lactoylglutathione lyase family enzyme
VRLVSAPTDTSRLVEITVGSPPAAWERIGFAVDDGAVVVGATRIRPTGAGGGIERWTLAGVEDVAFDGLATTVIHEAPSPRRPPEHPNGAQRIDHVVVRTPSLDRTVAAFDDAGLGLRRTRDAGGGVRQGFLWLGDTIVELVEAPGQDSAAPATFWGLVVVVDDIDRAAAIAGEALGDVRDAVQRGRRIATVREAAGMGLPLALMTPHVKVAR